MKNTQNLFPLSRFSNLFPTNAKIISFSVVTKSLYFTLEIYLANERSDLAFFGADLGHISASNVGNEFGVMLRGKDLTKKNLLTTLSTYTLSWYPRTCLNIITLETRRSHCCVFFRFNSKLKAGGIITTGQNLDYQTFSSLQFRPLLKNSFLIIHTDLKDESGETIPFVCAGITRVVLMFSNIHL